MLRAILAAALLATALFFALPHAEAGPTCKKDCPPPPPPPPPPPYGACPTTATGYNDVGSTSSGDSTTLWVIPGVPDETGDGPYTPPYGQACVTLSSSGATVCTGHASYWSIGWSCKQV